MSPADLAAVRRLVDILEGPNADLVPAEALHAVALIKGWKVEKGLRQWWTIDCPMCTTGPWEELGREGMTAILVVHWVPLARAAFNSPG